MPDPIEVFFFFTEFHLEIVKRLAIRFQPLLRGQKSGTPLTERLEHLLVMPQDQGQVTVSIGQILEGIGFEQKLQDAAVP